MSRSTQLAFELFKAGLGIVEIFGDHISVYYVWGYGYLTYIYLLGSQSVEGGQRVNLFLRVPDVCRTMIGHWALL